MPAVPETAWGHWGSPSPINAWSETEPTQLFGATGGELKQEYADTLKWYYKRTRNPSDKEHCLKLLTQLEVQKSRDLNSRRPQTAPKQVDARRNFNRSSPVQKKPITKPRPSSAANYHDNNRSDSQKTSYQQQLAVSQRLSRPKTVRYRLEQSSSAQSSRKEVQRPKSAMSSLEHRRVGDPYLTSYESDYPGYSNGLDAQAVRPMTAKGAVNPSTNFDSKAFSTTFFDNYMWKSMPKVEPIRSGTSSGNRNNNPHPQNGFMVWKLPRKNAEGQSGAPAKNRNYRSLSKGVLNQILVDKMKSTYQQDFMGVPQGYQVKGAIDCPVDWRDQVPKPSITTFRRTYNNTKQEPELEGNTTRYGCNKDKTVSALGIVPSVTKGHVIAQEGIKGKTTYEKYYEQKFKSTDLNKLMSHQDNRDTVNSFLRYARTSDQDVKQERAV